MKKILLTLTSVVISFTLHAQWLVTAGPNGGGHISSMAVKDSTVFAGTETGGVFTTTDHGDTWTASNSGLTNLNDVRAIATDSTYVFAGLGNSLGGPAVFSSTDDAASWSPTPLSFIFFWSFALKPGLLIAGTWDGVSVSTNHGVSWNSFTTGLPSNASVAALAFGGSKIFAGVNSSSVGGTGIFYSTNNGTSWNAFNTGLSNTTVDKLVVTGSMVFAGTASGVFKSATATAGWTSAMNGLTNTNIKSFLSVGGDLFAGTADGVFYTGDNGANWIDVSAGLPPNSTIYSLATDTMYMYAGSDSAVYRRPLSEVVTQTSEYNSVNANFSMYPNPASTGFLLTIGSLQSTEKEKYDVTIFNLVGKKVLHPVLNERNQAAVDVASLPAGIYFVTVTNESGISQTKKVVKL